MDGLDRSLGFCIINEMEIWPWLWEWGWGWEIRMTAFFFFSFLFFLRIKVESNRIDRFHGGFFLFGLLSFLEWNGME